MSREVVMAAREKETVEEKEEILKEYRLRDVVVRFRLYLLKL
jgi:hypothetical protein